MIETAATLPVLPEDEIHIWQANWAGGAGEARFASLLAGYAGPQAPAVIRGEHGKPGFSAPFDILGFNWSHSGDSALFAIGRGPSAFEVGVDVESVRPRARTLELARRFFAANETAQLKQLPESDRLDAFLALWTAKEAVLKAHGGGLSYGLHRVSFRLRGGIAVPESFDGDIGPAVGWSVKALPMRAGLVGAVAWRGGERRVRVFTSPG